jgi:hypothetical protein
LAVRWCKRRVLDAVDAERALGHHLALFIELARAVRTRPRAVLAADALVVVDEDDAVALSLVARTGRADRDARRVLAVQAALRKWIVSVAGKTPASYVCTRLKNVPVGAAPYAFSSASGPAAP